MDLKKPQFQRTARIVDVVCGSLFCIFAFLYLWNVQGPVLDMAQHVLSHGITVYHPVIGACIITFILWLIQRLVNLYFKLEREWYALSYFPSFLLLTMLTSVHVTVYDRFSLGHWVWLLPLCLLLFFFLVFVSKKIFRNYELRDGNLTVRILSPNLVVFILLSWFCLSLSNTDETFHNKLQIEYELSQGRLDEALEIGRLSSATSKDISALRAYALYKKNELGERLFDYPQQYGAEGLLLDLQDTTRMIFSPMTLYRELGAYPRYKGEPALEFLELLELSEKAHQPMTDQYLLCAYLLDRKLNRFAEKLDQVYHLNDSVPPQLPRYYQEALVLCIQKNPERFTYRNKSVETNYEEYQRTIKSIGNSVAARNLIRRDFGTTYWWYYDSVNQ